MDKAHLCHICGTETTTGEECTVTIARKSTCRPELAAPVELETWLCENCLWVYEVIGDVGRKWLEEHDIELEP